MGKKNIMEKKTERGEEKPTEGQYPVGPTITFTVYQVFLPEGNISLPGGFKMANSSNDYCDVATATGKNKFKWIDV